MKDKERKSGNIIPKIIIVISLIIVLFSGYNIAKILMNYGQSQAEYRDLKKLVIMEQETEAPEQEVQETEKKDEWGFTYGTPPDIDWKELREINPDIIGWIYIPAIDTSYPVLHGKDNDEYIHTTYTGTWAYDGSIFIETLNKTDFSDPHTIIFGHNMYSGTMFGKIRDIMDQETAPYNPYIWILTPRADYCYAMFSAQYVDINSDVYKLFAVRDKEFMEWEGEMLNGSNIRYPAVKFQYKTDHIITLSTCNTPLGPSARRVISAVRVLTRQH